MRYVSLLLLLCLASCKSPPPPPDHGVSVDVPGVHVRVNDDGGFGLYGPAGRPIVAVPNP